MAEVDRADEGAAPPPPDLRVTGARIESLLDASAAGGQVARERAEELVRLVVDLYGAGLERLLEILHAAGHLDAAVLRQLAEDELVASLLIVHGLHPYDAQTRVAQALDSVRPYLGSHGGDVELVGLDDEGVVTLRMLGSCDGCPSSSVTLTLAVETAIQEAAPEVTVIRVEEAPSASATASVIPISALRSRLDVMADDGVTSPSANSGLVWRPVEGLQELVSGQLAPFSVDGVALIGVRVGQDLYAYGDHCGRCSGSIGGATVARRLGGRAGDAVLRCPTCHAHYDVRHAGAGLDGDDIHLDPLPLLTRDGQLCLALPRNVDS